MRVIDSIHPIQRSQLCILPLLEGFDNLCFATPPDNESTEKSEESNDESGVRELPERFLFVLCFGSESPGQSFAGCLKGP